MSPPHAPEPSISAGASLYSRPTVLSLFYDLVVLRLSNSLIWRCPTASTLLPFFHRHTRASQSHLDIGVGTGFYLAHADLNPRRVDVTLCDLNPDALAAAKGRVVKKWGSAGGGVETLLWDVEVPLHLYAEGGDGEGSGAGAGAGNGDREVKKKKKKENKKFDSISLMYLLHCMPGPPQRKVKIFDHLRDNLADGGVLFGSTILGKGAEHNWGGRWLMGVYNQRGIFGNEGDGAGVFLEGLREGFEEVEGEVVGCVLLFVARRPRRR